jgi:hypothetical protein
MMDDHAVLRVARDAKTLADSPTHRGAVAHPAAIRILSVSRAGKTNCRGVAAAHAWRRSQVSRTLVVRARAGADNPCTAWQLPPTHMHKTLLNLNSIRAARDLRAGANARKISGEYGISLANIERIETVYGNVPDNLLAGIERLLNDREKLRRLISNLMHRSEFLP